MILPFVKRNHGVERETGVLLSFHACQFQLPRRPHVAELLLREIFFPVVRSQSHLNDPVVARVSKLYMPTLLSASSSLLREFWGLKSLPGKTGAAPDPLPRFDKLEPAHAASVVSFTRTCSQMMAAFVGVSIARSMSSMGGGRFSQRTVCLGIGCLGMECLENLLVY